MVRATILTTMNDLDRFWSKVQLATDGCWLWTFKRASTNRKIPRATFGYGGRTYPAARVMWQIVNGPVPREMFVCRRCDNPACVRPDHLFLGTSQQNALDAARRGQMGYTRRATYQRNRGARGRPKGLLSGPRSTRVVKIVSELRAGVLHQSAIARQYGVSRQYVSMIRQRYLGDTSTVKTLIPVAQEPQSQAEIDESFRRIIREAR
jgi:hypothetical protein